MKTWAEAALALGVTLVLGAALWLFTGQPLGGEDSPTTSTPVAVDTEAAARGEAVAQEAGCLACHSVDGTASTGPTWKGLYGASRPLVSGETVTADEAYIFNSIIDPTSQVVAGFEAVMPGTYSEQLTEAQINDIVEYIKSLG